LCDPGCASLVLLAYVTVTWMTLVSFGGVGGEFLSFGRGRAQTSLDTIEGQRAAQQLQIECLLVVIRGQPTADCDAALSTLLTQVIEQPTSPLLQIGGVVIDTAGKWSMYAVLMVANYAFLYYGSHTVQSWLMVDGTDLHVLTILRVFFIRFNWILFDFTIYIYGLLASPQQIDLFMLGVLGSIVAAFALTYSGMSVRSSGPRVIGSAPSYLNCQ
jgi:hypothetical protein